MKWLMCIYPQALCITGFGAGGWAREAGQHLWVEGAYHFPSHLLFFSSILSFLLRFSQGQSQVSVGLDFWMEALGENPLPCSFKVQAGSVPWGCLHPSSSGPFHLQSQQSCIVCFSHFNFLWQPFLPLPRGEQARSASWRVKLIMALTLRRCRLYPGSALNVAISLAGKDGIDSQWVAPPRTPVSATSALQWMAALTGQ